MSARRGAAALILGVGAIASVLALLPSAQASYEPFALPKEVVLPIAALVSAAVLLWRERQCDVTAMDVVVVLGVILAVASAFVQDTSVALTWRGLNVVVASAAVFLGARALRDEPRLVLLLAIAVVLGAIIVVAEAHGLIPSLSMPGRGPGGTEGNRNFMAHALVVGLPAVVAIALSDERRWLGRASLAGTAIVVAAVVMSRSRTAWIGLAIVVVITGLAWAWSGFMRTHRRRIARLAIAFGLGLVLAVVVPDRLHWRDANPYWQTVASLADFQTGTGRGRMIQYENTLSVIATHPVLGVGPGNWSRAYPEHATAGDPSYRPAALQPVNRLPNSDWLGLAAERGMFALLAHAALLALLALGWLRRVVARDQDPEAALWPGLLLGAVVAVAAMGALDAVLLRPTPAILAFALFGLGAPRLPALRTLPLSRWAAVPLLIVALMFAFDATRRLRAYELAEPRDIASLQDAVRVDPTAFQLRAELAVQLYSQGRCADMLEQTNRVRADYPHIPLLDTLAASCRR